VGHGARERVQAENGIAQRDQEGRFAREILAAQDGVAEAFLYTLAGVEEIGLEALEIDLFEKVLLLGFLERAEQFGIVIKVVFDGCLPRPVMKRMRSMPLETSSSTTYCTMGLRATGSISFGCDLVAGNKRVP